MSRMGSMEWLSWSPACVRTCPVEGIVGLRRVQPEADCPAGCPDGGGAPRDRGGASARVRGRGLAGFERAAAARADQGGEGLPQALDGIPRGSAGRRHRPQRAARHFQRRAARAGRGDEVRPRRPGPPAGRRLAPRLQQRPRQDRRGGGDGNGPLPAAALAAAAVRETPRCRRVGSTPRARPARPDGAAGTAPRGPGGSDDPPRDGRRSGGGAA